MTEIETWRPITCIHTRFNDRYQVSNCGRVRSVDRIAIDLLGRASARRGRLISPYVDGRGYLSVRLCVGRKRISQNIHVLVLRAFIGPRPAGMQGRHLNGNKMDCDLSNLAYGTPKDNSADKLAHGTEAQGSRNGQAKLTEAKVMEIRRLRAGGAGPAALSTRFALDKRRVREICAGRSWRHIPYGAQLTT